MNKILLYFVFIFFAFVPLKIYAETPKDIFFHVYRNGSKIGHHKINFQSYIDSNGSRFINADIEIKFKVKFLGFVVYDYFHKNKESWKKTPKETIAFACKGCNHLNFLNNLNSSTDKNGTKMFCNIESDKKKNGAFLLAKGSEAELSAHAYTMSSSYWDSHLVERNINENGLILDAEDSLIEKKVFNTQDCSLINFKIMNKGEKLIYNNELSTKHYKLNGEESNGGILDIDIWYDDSGNWVKMKFLKDGSEIEYFLDEYHKK